MWSLKSQNVKCIFLITGTFRGTDKITVKLVRT